MSRPCEGAGHRTRKENSMKQTTFTVKYDEEKLNAIRQSGSTSRAGRKRCPQAGQATGRYRKRLTSCSHGTDGGAGCRQGTAKPLLPPVAVRVAFASPLARFTPPGKAVRGKKMPPGDGALPKIRWPGRKRRMLWAQTRIRPNFPYGWTRSSWSWQISASGTAWLHLRTHTGTRGGKPDGRKRKAKIKTAI